MVADRSMVEQAHEVQALAKEFKDCSKENPYVFPEKFVAGAIIPSYHTRGEILL